MTFIPGTIGQIYEGGAGDFLKRTGFDLFWRNKYMHEQMLKIEGHIADLEKNQNLSDYERANDYTMLMNSWSAVGNARTNMIKCVADVLKRILFQHQLTRLTQGPLAPDVPALFCV